MADNVTLDPGAGGAVIATDDDGTAQHQYVKVEWGGDGTYTKVAAGSDALPIQDGGNTITVDGTVTASTITDLSKAEDSAHSSGDMGIMMLGVRNDAGSSTSDTNGDYTAIAVNSGGQVYVVGMGNTTDSAAAAGGTGSVNAKLRLATSQLDAIQTAVQTLDNAISGNEMVVSPRPATSGGNSIFRSIDLDESEEEVKATAGQVYGWHIYNAHETAVRYIKFYNATAANVTVGTTTPVITLPVLPLSKEYVLGTHGIAFGAAISVAATTGLADNDTGAPGANEVICHVFYT